MKKKRNTWAALAAPPAVQTCAPANPIVTPGDAPERASALSSRSVADDNLRKLDWLLQAVNLMRRGEALPPDIASWFATAFEAFVNEGGDLAARLGLKVRPGGRFRTVNTLNNLRRRNELLTLLVIESPHRDVSDGVKAAAAYLAGRGPEPVRGLSAVLKRHLEQIPLPIPGEKQLGNIVYALLPHLRRRK